MGAPSTERDQDLDQPVTADVLGELFWAGLIPRHGLDLGTGRHWRPFSSLLLLVLGSALILSGVVFFVAYNWQDLDNAFKLGGLQLLVVACAVAALWRGLHRIEGRVLLFAACFLVGVFLAAFGQIYQTGADAWELFRAWALLIAIWVVASRAPAHWLLLLAVTETSVATYFEQVQFYRWERETWAWLLLAAIQTSAIAGLELGNRSGYFRLRQVWPRWVLVPALLFFLCAPTTRIILEKEFDGLPSWIVLLGLVGAVAGGYRYFRHVAGDLFSLTCIGFACAWVVTVVAIRVLDVFESGGCSGFLFVGILVVAMLAGLVQWVRRVHVEMQGD